MSPSRRYDPVAQWMHWTLAFGIFAAIASGLYSSNLPFSPARLRWVNWHKWIGVSVLFLSAMRLAWRARHPAPRLPSTVVKRMLPWQRGAQAAVHWTMYVLFFAIPIAGWAYSSATGFPVVWLGVLPLPDLITADKELAPLLRTLHQTLAYGLGALAVLHMAAVVHHQFILRDGLLKRMLPELGKKS